MNFTVIIIMLFATIFAAFGSLFLKIGSDKLTKKGDLLKLIIKNKYVFFGLIGYGLGAILNILAYKQGNLSVVFPMTSLAYIWSLFLSKKYLDEKINYKKTISITLIILGVFLISL